MNLYLLLAVLSGACDLVHINAVNKFAQQWCCEPIHLHKLPNSGNKLFLAKLHFVGLCQAPTVSGYFLFQL